MKPFTTTLALLAGIASQFLPVANASTAMSWAHNTPSSSSATTTPASFVQTPPRSQPSVASTSVSTSTSRPVVVPAVAAGVVVPAAHGQDQPPPSPMASITQAPAAEATGKQPGAKFIQTTYYSCVTMGTYTHCGWHEPILDASTSAAAPAFVRWSWPALCWTAAAAVAMSAFVAL